MRRVLTSAGLALTLAVRAAAAQGLTIDWSRTAVTGGRTLAGAGPDGAVALELHGGTSGGSSFHLITVDQPPVGAASYVARGQVRYEAVEGQGYLEMWSMFADGRRFFTRTMATQGTLAALNGTSGWRRFELPFDPGGAGAPSRLEINLVLPGRGTVWLAPMRLEQSSAWWSARAGSTFGAVLGSLLGIVGGMIGALGGAGKARRLVLGLLTGIVVIGVGLALVGAAALWGAQPRHVWYPLLLPGVLATVIGLVLLRPLKLRYAADELRRMQAMDARRP